MTFLDREYWKERYQKQTSFWDIGYAAPAIVNFFKKVGDKQAKILIPGCGNAHEAKALFEAGFKQVYLCDWAEEALAQFHQECPDFPKEQLWCQDFFDIKEGGFDYIVEQTFFCAIDPSQRPVYAQKMASLLKEKGQLIGLLFEADFEGGPPFGGSKEEYIAYFQPYFSTIEMEFCLESIKPRQGRELFIELTK